MDVITGTIKANFPTRISFQVTSKIDSRTILGEQGAEQLLGQGDQLYMAGGGRITRLHGPFVSDGEVEAVAKFLREQGQPQYLEEVTAGADEGGEEGDLGFGGGEESNDLYDRAVAVVTRDGKASHQLHPAAPADRLQPRRLADRADGAGGRRRPRQPRRQARDPGQRRALAERSSRVWPRKTRTRHGIARRTFRDLSVFSVVIIPAASRPSGSGGRPACGLWSWGPAFFGERPGRIADIVLLAGAQAHPPGTCSRRPDSPLRIRAMASRSRAAGLEVAVGGGLRHPGFQPGDLLFHGHRNGSRSFGVAGAGEDRPIAARACG